MIAEIKLPILLNFNVTKPVVNEDEIYIIENFSFGWYCFSGMFCSAKK